MIKIGCGSSAHRQFNLDTPTTSHMQTGYTLTYIIKQSGQPAYCMNYVTTTIPAGLCALCSVSQDLSTTILELGNSRLISCF